MIRGPVYVPNRNFEREWLASSEALELVAEIAADVVPVAQALAPVRQRHLARSIEAEVGLVDGVATGRINAHDFKAGWWEFGHKGRSKPFLRPAVEAVTGKPAKGGRG